MAGSSLLVFLITFFKIPSVYLLNTNPSYCESNKRDNVYGQAQLNYRKLERAGFSFSQQTLNQSAEVESAPFISSRGSYPQDLGKCAIVGLGESLLYQSLGSFIDKFDSVIRFGWQPSFLPEVLGSKSTYVFVRKRPQRTYRKVGGQKCDLRFDRWNTLPANVAGKFLMPTSGIFYTSECKENENTETFFVNFPKWRVLSLLDNQIFLELQPFLKGRGSKRIPRPTSGAKFIFSLHKSHLCESIDLFGFGHRKYAGHIYEKLKQKEINSHRTLGKCMKFLHCLDCENLLYRKIGVKIN